MSAIISILCPCGMCFDLLAPVPIGGSAWAPCCGRLVTVVASPPAEQLPTAMQPQKTSNTVGSFLLGAGVAAFGGLGVFAAFKAYQVLTDEDHGDGEFPKWFREELIDDHIACHGYRCRKCNRGMRRRDLAIDHIVAMKNGGLTSKHNARVICRWCNSSKGARNDWRDYVLGRAA